MRKPNKKKMVTLANLTYKLTDKRGKFGGSTFHKCDFILFWFTISFKTQIKQPFFHPSYVLSQSTVMALLHSTDSNSSDEQKLKLPLFTGQRVV